MPLDPAHVIWSTPEREREGRPLLVLLHGLGSSEGDLFQLSPYLPLDWTIASPRAPIALDSGYSWFDPAAARPGALDAASDEFAAWLATASAGASRVALLGFSQGGVLALQVLRRHPDAVGAVAVLSGGVDDTASDDDAELATRKPPVFWGRGTTDQVIPASWIENTRDWLSTHATLTERIYEDVGHWITDNELADVNTYLRELV